ncbi:MAG: DUF835 domain-containing protein [Thermoplasmata archaeon]
MSSKGNMVMPIEAFDALENIMENPDADADKSLSAFGYKWGEQLVNILGETCSMEELDQFVKQISWEAGISKIKLKVGDGEIKVKIDETKIRNPHFLGGFMAGMISELLSDERKSRRYSFDVKKSEKNNHIFSLKEIEMTEKSETESENPPIHRDIENGYSYIVIEDEPTEAKKTCGIFQDFVTHGYVGMCMTTLIPTKVKGLYDLENTDVAWLTDYKTGSSEFRELNPKRLEFEISRDARKFLNQEGDRILMIHGLEYLIRHNGFEKISDFLDTLNRIISAKDNILICPIYPKALKELDYSNLKTILKIVGA